MTSRTVTLVKVIKPLGLAPMDATGSREVFSLIEATSSFGGDGSRGDCAVTTAEIAPAARISPRARNRECMRRSRKEGRSHCNEPQPSLGWALGFGMWGLGFRFCDPCPYHVVTA